MYKGETMLIRSISFLVLFLTAANSLAANTSTGTSSNATTTPTSGMMTGVSVSRNGYFEGQVASGNAFGYQAGKLTMQLNNSCWNGNLRNIASGTYPLAPSATVVSNFMLTQGSDQYLFSIAYPGTMAAASPSSSSQVPAGVPTCLIVKKNPQGVTVNASNPTAALTVPDSMNCACLVGSPGYSNSKSNVLCQTSIAANNPQVQGITIKGGYWNVSDVGSTNNVNASLANNVVSVSFPLQATMNSQGGISSFMVPTAGSNSVSSQVSLAAYSFQEANVDCNASGAYDIYSHPTALTNACTPCAGSNGTISGCGTTNNTSYMGNNGPLFVRVNNFAISQKNVNGQIAVNMNADVQIAGQVAFCGGWYSPLMVFFSDDRPQFSAVSSFPIDQYGGMVHWPEAGSPGGFLVFDHSKKGKIQNKEDLFTDTETAENGFEALKKFDTNHDGFITAEDKDFSRLKLWFDRNGDSISQKDELEPLSKRIVKISLKYKKVINRLGANAEEREVADFWYKDSQDHNKIKKGQIVDVWFSKADKTAAALADSKNNSRSPANTH